MTESEHTAHYTLEHWRVRWTGRLTALWYLLVAVSVICPSPWLDGVLLIVTAYLLCVVVKRLYGLSRATP